VHPSRSHFLRLRIALLIDHARRLSGHQLREFACSHHELERARGGRSDGLHFFRKLPRAVHRLLGDAHVVYLKGLRKSAGNVLWNDTVHFMIRLITQAIKNCPFR
jgi:hypothetical protein